MVFLWFFYLSSFFGAFSTTGSGCPTVIDHPMIGVPSSQIAPGGSWWPNSSPQATWKSQEIHQSEGHPRFSTVYVYRYKYNMYVYTYKYIHVYYTSMYIYIVYSLGMPVYLKHSPFKETYVCIVVCHTISYQIICLICGFWIIHWPGAKWKPLAFNFSFGRRLTTSVPCPKFMRAEVDSIKICPDSGFDSYILYQSHPPKIKKILNGPPTKQWFLWGITV